MIPVGIKIVDDLISNCEEVVEYLETQTSWQRSRVGASNSVDPIRTSDTLSVSILSFANPLMIHEMNKKVWLALDDYAKEYDFSFTGVEDVAIQRYVGDQHYKAHIDHAPSAPRVVSAVLYLNTVEEGGETRFTLFDYSVEPIAGRLAIFPSNYVYKHEALPPKKGVKIAAAYWARG